MEREHWQKIDRLCHSALEVEESQRAAFIENACGGDEQLKSEVESVLAHAETDSFLAAPAAEIAAKALVGQAVPPANSVIGHYRILHLLGEGGMGAVYEAEQDQPRRTVALKVIKPGFATAETMRRFQHESQALGRLQHPGIAQIYEAGTADTGFGPQPYFAMELVRGLPLHEHAEGRQLNARERLALMAKICDAVEHAHQRGVIHRDLKPGNILVDETGQPKILDFGVARVTESDTQPTRQTDVGQLVGTLAYMSPEQVLGDPSALDNRTDVYSLGVILYELLAGKLPYNISRKPLPEAVEVIREAEPAALSSIHRSYRGDIDTIVAKALEKYKARRYASAADLGGDIRRHLADQPIAARPASASYQLQKFARRHKAMVAGTAAVFLGLAAGVVASTWEAVRARTAQRAAVEQRDRAAAVGRLATAQRDRAVAADARAQEERNAALSEKRRADAEAATAQSVNDFLQNDLLAQASSSNQARPNTKPDPDLKVRTALDRAAARVGGKFDRQPEVEAAIHDTIGQSYMDLGLYPGARKQFEQALELHRRIAGEKDPKTLKTMGRLGRALFLQGKHAEARVLLSHAFEVSRRVLGPEHPETLYSLTNLATVYLSEGKASQAEAIHSQILKIRQRALGPEHPSTLGSMNNLAITYEAEGKYPQAEALQKKTLEIRRRVQGPDHPETVMSMSNLAVDYAREGKQAQAEALHGQVLEIRRRVLGADHPDTLAAMSNLAVDYHTAGKYAQAEALFSQSLEGRRRVLGPEHPETLDCISNLAYTYEAQGKYPQAEALHSQVVEIRRRVLGPEHPATLSSMLGLGNVYYRQHKYERVEALFSQVVEMRRRVSGPEHPDTIGAMNNLAAVYMAQAKHGQAEALFSQTLEIEHRVLAPEHPYTLDTMNNLANVYALQGKYPPAETLETRVLEVRRRILPPEHPLILNSMHDLAYIYTGQGRYMEAEKLLAQAIEGQRRALGPEHPDTLGSIADAAAVYQRDAKYASAEQFAAQALAGRRKALGPEEPDTMDSAADLVLAYQSQGKFAESEPLAREALEIDRRKRPDDWQRFRAETLLGASLSGQKKYAEAEPLLLQGYQGMAARKDRIAVPDQYHLDRAREWIVQFYEAWGKREKAAEWKKE